MERMLTTRELDGAVTTVYMASLPVCYRSMDICSHEGKQLDVVEGLIPDNVLGGSTVKHMHGTGFPQASLT